MCSSDLQRAERDLPLLPGGQQIPQIQIISVDYPKPPTPPPVLPPVTTVSSEVRSVDMPWNNSRPSTASPESAPPEQTRSVEEAPISGSTTELIAPAAAADSQMVLYAGTRYLLVAWRRLTIRSIRGAARASHGGARRLAREPAPRGNFGRQQACASYEARDQRPPD